MPNPVFELTGVIDDSEFTYDGKTFHVVGVEIFKKNIRVLALAADDFSHGQVQRFNPKDILATYKPKITAKQLLAVKTTSALSALDDDFRSNCAATDAAKVLVENWEDRYGATIQELVKDVNYTILNLKVWQAAVIENFGDKNENQS